MSSWGSVSACLLFGFSRLPYILLYVCPNDGPERLKGSKPLKRKWFDDLSVLLIARLITLSCPLFAFSLSLAFYCQLSPSISLLSCALALILSIFSSRSQRSWHLCHRSSPPSLLWRWPSAVPAALLKFHSRLPSPLRGSTGLHSNPLDPFKDRQQSEQCKLLRVIDSQLLFRIYQGPSRPNQDYSPSPPWAEQIHWDEPQRKTLHQYRVTVCKVWDLTGSSWVKSWQGVTHNNVAERERSNLLWSLCLNSWQHLRVSAGSFNDCAQDKREETVTVHTCCRDLWTWSRKCHRTEPVSLMST